MGRRGLVRPFQAAHPAQAQAGGVPRFARWLYELDPRYEIPPAKVIPGLPGRRAPHIYTPEQVGDLMNAASGLTRFGRRDSYPVFFGLLAVTGMRVSEAIGLSRRHGLRRWCADRHRQQVPHPRLIPLHPTTAGVLRDLASPSRPNLPDSPLFANPGGGRLAYGTVRDAFNQMRTAAGLSGLDPTPRIHDLRHTFAVNTLLG